LGRREPVRSLVVIEWDGSTTGARAVSDVEAIGDIWEEVEGLGLGEVGAKEEIGDATGKTEWWVEWKLGIEKLTWSLKGGSEVALILEGRSNRAWSFAGKEVSSKTTCLER
jgi:hypothetical protein